MLVPGSVQAMQATSYSVSRRSRAGRASWPGSGSSLPLGWVARQQAPQSAQVVPRRLVRPGSLG